MQKKSHSAILFDRTAALAALLCTAVYDYGIRILLLAAAAVLASLTTERLCTALRRQPFTRGNLDAAVSGVILMMLMPPTVSVSLLIMSCIFGNIIGRQVFGGRKNPVLPAAAAGYVFALCNARAQMTMFPAAKGALPLLQIDESTLVSGISETFSHSGKITGSVTDLLTGLPAQPVGTGSVVLLLVIAAVLMLRRSASALVLLPSVLVCCITNLLLSDLRHPVLTLAGALLSHQFLFAAIFLLSDPEYAPPQTAGIFFGLICGIAAVMLTRFLYVYDAPVLLAVLLSPLGVILRHVMQDDPPETAAAGEDGDLHEAS